jgi:dolichol-phosphate mannosyltransferase
MPRINLSEIKLSILVTVFSETRSIIETVETLINHDRGYIQEIILLVSPRASKETFSICEEMTKKYTLVKIHVQVNNPGIGWAFREGIDIAAGNYMALMSADLETELAAVDRMVRKIEETGCDAVVANRWLKGGGFTGYDPLKLILNWLFQKIFRIIFWTRIGDLSYGYKILSWKIAKTTKWHETMHGFCVETTVRPIKDGYYFEEIPSSWVGRKEGKSVNKLLSNFSYVWLALKIRFNMI